MFQQFQLLLVGIRHCKPHLASSTVAQPASDPVDKVESIKPCIRQHQTRKLKVADHTLGIFE